MNLILQILTYVASAGGGGYLIYFFTLRSIIRKARAAAKGAEINNKGLELDNVDKAAKIWRELTTGLREEVKELRLEVEKLKKTACYKEECENRINQ
jgi:hypothetical protein